MFDLESGLSENQTNPVKEAQTESELINQPVADETLIHETEEVNENYSQLSKQELLQILIDFENEEIGAVKHKVLVIKDAYENLISAEREIALSKFIEEGGMKEDFKQEGSDLDEKFFASVRKFNKRKAAHFELLEKERLQNLKTKQGILSEMKNLIQNEENMQHAFEKFHDLQATWRNTGAVPAANVNDLWQTYKLFTDKFYELIKRNRELQELDYKKNLEAKLILCEKAEELLLEPSLNKSLIALKQLQDLWRETGPVSREKKNEMWERFKAASDKVYERRREFFESLKSKQAVSLEAKKDLIAKVEQLLREEILKAADWLEKTKALAEIQNAWKKTGYADKKSNDELWASFRKLCEEFFNRKNEFFHHLKKKYAGKQQQKTELCIQAEALRESEDWRKATDELKRLQQQWKDIGYSGEKKNDLWDRFRTACDGFFKRKAEHYASIEAEQKKNLEIKTQLVDEAEKFIPSENAEEAVEQIKNFQRRWSEAGPVPFAKKDELQKRFREAIDKHFKKINPSGGHRASGSKQFTPRPGNEKNDLKYRMNQLNSEVNTLENNLGFFAKSKNAESLKKEFEEKINRAKEEIKKLKQQLNDIDKPVQNSGN